MSHDKSYNKICRICGKKRKWKMLNKLFVSGTINRGFFRKSKDFELVIYFSGLKKLIFEVYSDDINLKDPKLGSVRASSIVQRSQQASKLEYEHRFKSFAYAFWQM